MPWKDPEKRREFQRARLRTTEYRAYISAYKRRRRELEPSYREDNLRRNKAWRDENHGYQATRKKKYLDSNLGARIASRLRNRLRDALKNRRSDGSAVSLLGCSLEEFRRYLESKFTEGMTWDNWAPDGWHIDHIKALSKFDLSRPVELAEACHFTNLQPLWALDNIVKGGR